LKPDDPPERRLDQLEAVLVMGTSRVQAVAPLFAALLSIPFTGRYPPLALTSAQQRRQTLAALLDQFEGLARQQPILLLFEDVQWADPTSIELLDLTLERIRHLPVLAIFTFRPEFETPWTGLPNVSALALGRLDQSRVQTMVSQLAGGRRLPAEVMNQIVAKTDGIPLFVEELTKAVMESGILVEDALRPCGLLRYSGLSVTLLAQPIWPNKACGWPWKPATFQHWRREEAFTRSYVRNAATRSRPAIFSTPSVSKDASHPTEFSCEHHDGPISASARLTIQEGGSRRMLTNDLVISRTNCARR
jgi:hypothetical protein